MANIAKSKQRVSSDERRQLILDAAIPLFVEQGFKGVTTRLLAQKAGVSEALLYQHFPSKEALYSQVQDHLCSGSPHLSDHVQGLTPGTGTLVWVLYIAARYMIDPPARLDTSPLFPRLMLQSLMEDGEFVRLHTQQRLGVISDVVTASMRAAKAAGDIVTAESEDLPEQLLFWFSHHVMAMVHLMHLADRPVLDYPGDRKHLINCVMLYVLRGIGLTEAAMKKHYCPTQLREQFADMFERT